MSENDKLEKRKRRTRSICILTTVLFITVMLIMPLLSIIASSLKEYRETAIGISRLTNVSFLHLA